MVDLRSMLSEGERRALRHQFGTLDSSAKSIDFSTPDADEVTLRTAILKSEGLPFDAAASVPSDAEPND